MTYEEHVKTAIVLLGEVIGHLNAVEELTPIGKSRTYPFPLTRAASRLLVSVRSELIEAWRWR
jgi:hypothetical protein